MSYKKNKKQGYVKQLSDKASNPRKTSKTAPVETVVLDPKQERLWKILFWSFAALILVCMLIAAPRTGIAGDECLDGLNGKYSLEYYANGDTTFTDYTKVPALHSHPHLKYYGSGYEILPAIALKYLHLPAAKEFVFRHILCALFGFLLILFTGLIGRLLANWKLGLISLLMIALSPVVFGLSFLDSKDIPMATGFAIAVYAFLALFKSLPNFKVAHIVLGIVGIGMAVSIRIGGLMLPLYLVAGFVLLLIFDKEKRQLLFAKPCNVLWKTLGVGALIVVVGSLLGLCFYPNFFYEGPVAHIKGALTLVSKFPQRIPMVFEGEIIDSLSLPDFYLIKCFLYTTPLFVFVAVALFLANIVRVFKKHSSFEILFLLFTIIFPFLYIILTNAHVYNGWRHELFIYPCFVVLASLGFYETTLWFRNRDFGKIWRWVCLGAAVAMVTPTIIWMVRNNRYIYCYYNILISDPYLYYDLDFYESSSTLAYEWFIENELPKCHNVVTVSTKIQTPVVYAEALGDTYRVRMKQSDYSKFARTDCDYSILNYQCVNTKAIKDFFPPKGTIHVEYVDDIPICAVVKRNKLDSRAIKLCEMNQYLEALPLLDSAYNYDTTNFSLWFWIGMANFETQNRQKSIKFLQKDLGFLPTAVGFTVDNTYIGIMQYEMQEYDEALNSLRNAESACDKEELRVLITGYLGLTYFEKRMYKEALPYLKEALIYYPTYPDLSEKYSYCEAMCQ